MRTAIVGAGPTGLYLGMALARRGHVVTIVDRDTGPEGDRWDRKGVMQFHHPHGFRQQVIEALLAEMPDVWEQLIAAGAEPMTLPNEARPAGFHCRRMVFERVLRSAAAVEPGVELRIGHTDRVLAESGRAVGLSVDGYRLDADLVLDASGRGGRIGDPFREAAVGSDCGLAYVSRQYQLLPGAAPGPVNSVIGFAAPRVGYEGFVFAHDNGVISALVARATTDRELAGLRVTSAFDAAYAPSRAWTSGPSPVGPVRSPGFCPARGCTTVSVGSSPRPVGSDFPGCSLSATRSAQRIQPSDAGSPRR